MPNSDTWFILSTKEAILEFQQASRNINTDKSKDTFIKFREFHNYSDEIIDLDNQIS